MIEACQMKNSVQHQNLHFIRGGMPEAPGILPRDVGGNRHSPASVWLVEFTVGGEGNDNTSVALFLPRNCRFRERSSALFVTNTFTVSPKRAARLARNTKRPSADGLSPAILFRRITNLLPMLWF